MTIYKMPPHELDYLREQLIEKKIMRPSSALSKINISLSLLLTL
jgi:hypothetical protein